MNKLLSCEYNMDIACVELKYADGTMIAIDTNAVEREFGENMYQTGLANLQQTIGVRAAGSWQQLGRVCERHHGTSVDRLRMQHFIQRVISRWMFTLTRTRVIIVPGGV